MRPADLPSNSERRDEIQAFARLHEGTTRTDNLRQSRLSALKRMRLLHRFPPRLIGGLGTSHIRQGSELDIRVFSDSIASVTAVPESEMLRFDVERTDVKKDGQHRIDTHAHVKGDFPFEPTVYGCDKQNFAFKRSITGKAIERASIKELE